MTRFWKLTHPLALTVAAIACAPPEAAEPPAADEPVAEAQAQDATVADPSHYTAEFENERIRVVRIKYGPGEGSVMHHHPDHVAVFLTDLDGEFVMPDGTVQEVKVEAGSSMFVPGGAHHPSNNGDQPFEAVAIEIKGAAPAGEPVEGETGPDPTVVDAAHYEAGFENDRIRVVRVRYGPGEESPMHYHPEHLAVFLGPQHFAFSTPDGERQELRFEAGQHFLAPAGQHQPTNLGEEPAEVVLVELK